MGALLVQAHISSLKNDPSFQWFLSLAQSAHQSAAARALSRSPSEDREYLVGRAQGVADVLSILPVESERVRKEREGK